MSIRKQLAVVLILILTISMLLHTASYADPPVVVNDFSPNAEGNAVTISTGINMGESAAPTGNGGKNPSKLSPIYVDDSVIFYLPSHNGPGDGTYTVYHCDPATWTPADELVPSDTASEEGAVGVVHNVMTFNRATFEELDTFMYCKPTNPGPGYAVPLAARPPTYTQIWNSVFNQTIVDTSRSSGAYVAPASPGLTGLPSKFWAQFPTGQSIQQDVILPSGYRVTTTVTITNFQIYIKTPSNKIISIANLSPSNGAIAESSHTNPIGAYNFKKSGTYVVSTGVVWTAITATIAANGVNPVTVPIGSIRLEINRDYQVNQLRGVITQ